MVHHHLLMPREAPMDTLGNGNLPGIQSIPFLTDRVDLSVPQDNGLIDREEIALADITRKRREGQRCQGTAKHLPADERGKVFFLCPFSVWGLNTFEKRGSRATRCGQAESVRGVPVWIRRCSESYHSTGTLALSSCEIP